MADTLTIAIATFAVGAIMETLRTIWPDPPPKPRKPSRVKAWFKRIISRADATRPAPPD